MVDERILEAIKDEEPVAEETKTEVEVNNEPAPETKSEPTPEEKPVEAPAEEVKAPVAEQKKADPCEAKVKAFEKYVDELAAAQKNKAAGAKALKAFSDLFKQAKEQKDAIKDCMGNEEFKTRLQNAVMQCNKILAEK